MEPELKIQFALQRMTIFGNGRYWFHVAIWVLVIFMGSIFSPEFAKGWLSWAGDAINSDQTITLKHVAPTAKSGQYAPKKDDKQLNQQYELLGKNDSLIFSKVASALIAVVAVYFFLSFVVPLAQYRRSKSIILLGLPLAIIIYVVLLLLAIGIGELFSPYIHNDAEQQLIIMLGIFMLFFITTYFFSFYYFIDLFDQQKKLDRYQEVLTEKLAAEIDFLKLQINPHFLFNTLNNIYSLSLAQSNDTAVIAKRLKELVHYMLTDCARPMVRLIDEIDFLRNYVLLEKLRTQQKNTSIGFLATGNAGDQQIAPLLLVNFIENAFKHGVRSGIGAAFIDIRLTVESRQLLLKVVNSRPGPATDKSLAMVEVGGIGLKNVKRRLEILYSKRHRLKIITTKTEYAVHLTIMF